MPVGGGVICRPVIAERGLSGASHLVGLTVEGWHSQTTGTAMPGKLWFPRNRGDKYARKSKKYPAEEGTRGMPVLYGNGSPTPESRKSTQPKRVPAACLFYTEMCIFGHICPPISRKPEFSRHSGACGLRVPPFYCKTH